MQVAFGTGRRRGSRMKRAFYAPTVRSDAVWVARLGSCPSMPASASLRGWVTMPTPPITACRRMSLLACQPFKVLTYMPEGKERQKKILKWYQVQAQDLSLCQMDGKMSLCRTSKSCTACEHTSGHSYARRDYVTKTTRASAMESITEEAAERLQMKAVDVCPQPRFDGTSGSSCQ